MSPITALPSISAMPCKKWPGADNLDFDAMERDGVVPLETLGWQETWNERFNSDAHFVCYMLRDGGQMPRCNKRALPHIREAGGDLVTRMLVFDYDNPGHAQWTTQSLEEWIDKFIDITLKWELGAKWSVLYATKHGARIIYLLDNPVPVDVAEGMHRWLLVEWEERGLHLDTSCSDWTRLFRLPCVRRLETNTWEQDYFFLQSEAKLLPTVDLGSITNPLKRKKGKVREFNLPQPLEDIGCELLTKISDKGREVMSDWRKKAGARLKGKACAPCLFQHKEMGQEEIGRAHV